MIYFWKVVIRRLQKRCFHGSQLDLPHLTSSLSGRSVGFFMGLSHKKQDKQLQWGGQDHHWHGERGEACWTDIDIHYKREWTLVVITSSKKAPERVQAAAEYSLIISKHHTQIKIWNNFRQSSSHCPGRPLPLDNSRSCCKFQCSIRTVWSLQL